jgi:alpha-D-xyloside xylohydrolase
LRSLNGSTRLAGYGHSSRTTRVHVWLGSALVTLGIVACGASREPLRAEVSGSGLPIAVGNGHERVTELGGKDAPLVFWTTGGAEHHVTQVRATSRHANGTTYALATDDGGRTASVSVMTRGSQVRIRYAVSQPGTVVAIGFSMAASADAHFLGTGQRERWVDMSRTVQPLKVYNGCDSSSPSPFFASTAGFGAWVTTTAVGRIAFPGAVDDSNFACDLGSAPCSVGPPADAVRWCFDTASANMTIALGSLPQILTAHARSVGLPRKPWLPQLALMKWRDEVSGPSELLDDIHQLRSRDIPIGWVVLDNPWEQGTAQTDCYGSLTFDAARYPNPKRMIAEIHDLGVRFMLWISPQIDRKGCPAPDEPSAWLGGDDETYVRDLTLPAARAHFDRLLDRLVALGVDGFKGDRGDEVNLEPRRLAGGPGTREQNAFPLLYDEAARGALAGKHGAAFATLFRSAVPGASAVLPGFVGPDAEQSFDGLEGEIRAAQTAGVAGIPVWGSDVGGYSGGSLTPNLFVRWAQFAALTPIFEVGGAGANATFWRLGDAAVTGLRDAARLHYELVPYLYSLASSASRNGIPVVRPLGLSWPDTPAAWTSLDEFTVGPGLLAAPVHDDGSSSEVYLPPGRWIDLFTHDTYDGDATITRTNGPDDFPLYLRVGSAVPFDFRRPVVWSDGWRTNDLLRANRQGWLVSIADDGSVRSTPDRGATVTSAPAHHGTTLIIHHALREEQLRIYPAHPVCGVEAGARLLPRVGLGSLAASASSWAHFQGQVVVKVAAAAPTTRLTLTSC